MPASETAASRPRRGKRHASLVFAEHRGRDVEQHEPQAVDVATGSQRADQRQLAVQRPVGVGERELDARAVLRAQPSPALRVRRLGALEQAELREAREQRRDDLRGKRAWIPDPHRLARLGAAVLGTTPHAGEAAAASQARVDAWGLPRGLGDVDIEALVAQTRRLWDGAALAGLTDADLRSLYTAAVDG